jgi:hypothetical protein
VTDSTYYEDLRAAVRILFIILAAADPLAGDDDMPGAVGVLRTETKLQKLDFWVRNPDYLADELMTEYEEGNRPDGLLLAERILSDHEPDLRRIPMLRFKFGAYEPLDTALAILESRGLVQRKRSGDALHVVETKFYLLERGGSAVQELVQEFPALTWYRDRAALATSIVGDANAAELRARQYLQQEYADAPRGSVIPAITERALERCAKLRGRA